MSTNPPPGSQTGSGTGSSSGAGRRIEEAVERIQAELRQAVAYVNANVVPQVRRESVTAMRSVADTLRNLADRIDKEKSDPKGPES